MIHNGKPIVIHTDLSNFGQMNLDVFVTNNLVVASSKYIRTYKFNETNLDLICSYDAVSLSG